MKKLLFILLLSFTSIVFAEGLSEISGKIIDAQNGTPLVGANVMIEGTILGAATDTQGKYTIQNIPVGNYILVATYLGYNRVKLNVDVVKDSTVILEFHMQSESIETEAVEIISTKPGINYNISSSFSKVASDYYQTHNTEEYSKIDENTFLDVISSPLSTFAADVDGASYSNARRFIIQNQLPYKDAVRTEEFINYFSYDYLLPKDDDPLSINLEYSDCSWNEKHKLVHVGIKGKELRREDQKPSNLVFLLDVSGSMNAPNKLPLLQKSFRLLVDQLNPADKIAIVVYAGSAGVILPSTSCSEKEKIIQSLNRLQAGGSTAGGEGIKLAYKIAKENLIIDGNNRIILATDGDFNVGISSTSELVRFIEEKRDEGIYLTVLGFGMGNYKDNRLQELADRGNGNHAYIDNILEAKKVLVNEVTSTLFTIAKDVKIQVEFNPAYVKSYRLIGYENRMLEDKDFEDEKKDAGEIGAGHTVTALYEILENNDGIEKVKHELKYQETKIKDSAEFNNELLTVRIKYKSLDDDGSHELSSILFNNPIDFKNTSNNFRFSSAVVEFAQILRDSEHKANSSINSVKELAKSSLGEDKYGYRAEFLNLVERVEILLNED